MQHFTMGQCAVRWNGRRLVLGNDLFSRTWSLRDGILVPHTFEAFGTEWFEWEPGAQGSAAPVPPLPAPHGGWLPAGEPAFSARANTASPVGEPFLEVHLAVGEVAYEFRVWEAVAGCAMRLVLPNGPQAAPGQAAVDATAGSSSTGVETDPPQGMAGPLRLNVLERFQVPDGHFKLLQVQLQDRTDDNAELVHQNEWLLHPCGRNIRLRGNLFCLEGTINGQGLLFWKHASLPESRAEQISSDLELDGHQFTFLGHGTKNGAGDWWMLQAYRGSERGRVNAARTYQRQWRRYDARRDGLLLSNTWGDRGRDAHLNPQFMAKELEAAARLGVDVVQIDDGWQQGTTSNSAQSAARGGVWNGFWAADANFWDVNHERFPEGLGGLFQRARELGLNMGLWFAPDSSSDCANWQRDAEALLRHHRELGVNHFKIDGLKLHSRLGENNARALFAHVLEQTNGAVTFDLDITAEHRFGYLGEMEAGPLFVENRYTDWHRYWPHHTLRAGWMLSHWIDPVRLRLEFLNVARNAEKYEGDVLAPARWRPDALFATVMPFSPLGWFEIQNLPPAYFQVAAPLIHLWKEHREAWHTGNVFPVGAAPDGVAWTGFLSLSAGGQGGYALIFRELNGQAQWSVPVLENGVDAAVQVLAGSGTARIRDGHLHVEIPEVLRFLWVKW